MGTSDKKLRKKQLKAQIKAAKFDTEASSQLTRHFADKSRPSRIVKVADVFRGVLYLILAVSIIVAIILSNKGYIITFEDIFESLVAERIGKVILYLFAASFFILGLKHLRAIR